MSNYVKKPKFTIEEQIIKLFNDNKDLFNEFNFINPSLTSDIRKKSKKLFENKQIASIARKVKSKLDILPLDAWYLYLENKSFEYRQFVRLVGYVQLNNSYQKWNKTMDSINKIKIKFDENGKVETMAAIKFKYYARYKNIYFKNLETMFLFIMNDLKYKVVILNEDFCEYLKSKFHVKKINIKAMAANLERYQVFQKIEAKTFILARPNKLGIANEILEKVNNASQNIIYFTKNILFKLISDVIEKHELLDDEPYYIFKKYFGHKFYFSQSNEMFFTRIKKYASYNMQERINYFVKKPQVLNIYELESQLGINKFGAVNNIFIKYCGPNFLIYIHNDQNHRAYFKSFFLGFFKKLDKNAFQAKKVRAFCKLAKDINMQRLSDYKHLPWIITNLFEFIQYDKTKYYQFQIQNKNLVNSKLKV